MPGKHVDSTVIDCESRVSATDPPVGGTDPPVGGIVIGSPFILRPRGDCGIKKYNPNPKTEQQINQ